MISHKIQMIFVHIPKTSGVSLTNALVTSILGYNSVDKDEPFCSVTLKNQFSLRGQQKHRQAIQMVPIDVRKDLWDKYYKFAFVRNPWDRIISEFHWRHELISPKHKPPNNFQDFIYYSKERLKDINNKKRDIYWTHAQTQKSYVTNNKGNIILNDIFKFENIKDNIKIIEKKINISIKLPKHNTSKHGHYKEYYNKKTKEMVYRLYKDDIEMFNYEF